MKKEKTNIIVGSKIFTMLSEALYSNPDNVFREYVQNSIDSINSSDKFSVSNRGEIGVYLVDSKGVPITDEEFEGEMSLVFVDNGIGYDENIDNLITTLALSNKDRIKTIGYKGIGRLSGYSFCQSITFRSYNSKENDSVTLHTESIRRHLLENESDFDIAEHFDHNKNTIAEEYIKNNSFCVVMNNIDKMITDKVYNHNFINDISSKIHCLYNEEIDTTNELIIEFVNDINCEIKHALSFNSLPIERKYKTNSKFDQDFLQNLYCKGAMLDEDKPYATVITKIGNQVAVGYRRTKKLDAGISIYKQGMLVAKDIDVVEKIFTLFDMSSTISEYIDAIRTFYVEVHIDSKHIFLNSSRNWFSYLVPSESEPLYIASFMEYLRSLLEKEIDSRYKYSFYKREKDLNKIKTVKDDFFESLDFFVQDQTIDVEILKNRIINDEEKKKKGKDRTTIIKENLTYLLPNETKYVADDFNKLNTIIEELAKLNFNTYKNASAVLFRTFLELTTLFYQVKNPELNFDNEKLRNKLSLVCEHVTSNCKSEPKAKLVAMNNNVQVVLENRSAMNILNGYVHDLDIEVNKIVMFAIRDALLPILDIIYL